MESISAIIVDTTYHNENNNYSVLRVLYNDIVTNVVGYLPQFISNEQVTFFGEWIEHSLYGIQFNAKSYEIETPDTIKGIESFLASGIIKGIRSSTAKLIVEKFGKNTFDVLDNEPIKLLDIKGIGQKRYTLIMESYYEIVGIRNVLITLQKYGFSTSMSIKISKFYGENTLKILKSNPYRLIEEIE
ncbi:MAG: ATP-dependent RecD-like DNA helicase, partial [Christensenellaceae bacterium]|nr:ATP-dependent RecD-like DNA helicase [Christensenellaceae bacterium]